MIAAGGAVRVSLPDYRKPGSASSRRRCATRWSPTGASRPPPSSWPTFRTRAPRSSCPRCATATSCCCRSRRAAGARISTSSITRRISRRTISTSRRTRGCASRSRRDAIVHLGTHGTLEWLDGKDVGQNEDDASDALIADLPDLYVYNVDVVGEGLVARRRGLATLVDHMVPPFNEGRAVCRSRRARRADQRLRSEPAQEPGARRKRSRIRSASA